MIKLNLVTGQRYGRLIVLEKREVNQYNHRMYLCRCDCGKEKEYSGHRLINGHTKSCGCLNRELARERRLLPKGESAFNQTFVSYQGQARRRKIGFNLSKDEFKKITSQNCFYCGNVPTNEYKNKCWNGSYKYNGIDRIDNTQGYIKDNIVPCCFICNIMKGQMSLNQFKEHINQIVSNWIMRIK